MDGTDDARAAARRAVHFFIVCSALGEEMQRVAAFMAISKCKDLHSHRKQAFGAARMPITRKCQGRRGILPECLTSTRRRRHYS
jgi:hypothetical protein